MSLEQLWYYINTSDNELHIQNKVIHFLTSLDLRLNRLSRNVNNPEGSGIIFYDHASSDFLNLIREITNGGFNRVLAIAVDPMHDSSDVWHILQAGASDVLKWEDSQECANEIRLRFERWKDIDALLESFFIAENMIGESITWKKTLRRLVEISRFTDSPVLITGESGTGKELAARLIHNLDSSPHKRDFVVLDCTTIIPTLSGSEFFGHERGAFTGAVSARDGAFSRANGGTLFLDEVGDLPLDLQAQLLRVIQEHTYKRVGGDKWYHTDFRLICATNRNLQNMVEEGRFRSDLYYRIASWTCVLPHLRERKEDIIPLSRHFMRKFSPKGITPRIDSEVESYLIRREYPGNVRELKQLVSRIMNRSGATGRITVGMIPDEDRPEMDAHTVSWNDHHFEKTIHQAILLGCGLKEIGKKAEDIAVRIAVNAENGNLQRAATRLGVSDRALQLRRAARKESRPEGKEKPSV